MEHRDGLQIAMSLAAWSILLGFVFLAVDLMRTLVQ